MDTRLVVFFLVGSGLALLVIGAVFVACGAILNKAAARKKSARCFLSPSEICSRFHEQGCDYCEDLACGDNTSPAHHLLRQSIDVYLVLQAGNPVAACTLARLGEAIEQCGGRLSVR